MGLGLVCESHGTEAAFAQVCGASFDLRLLVVLALAALVVWVLLWVGGRV